MHDMANLLSDLMVARDTNRRLNRRLGDAESSLNRLVSEAQNEVSSSHKRLSKVYEDLNLYMGWFRSERDRTVQLQRTIGLLIAMEVLCAGWAFAATAIAFRYWLRS